MDATQHMSRWLEIVRSRPEDATPEWVLFIMLVRYVSYPSFYAAIDEEAHILPDGSLDMEALVRWSRVVRTFNARLTSERLVTHADVDHVAKGARAQVTGDDEALASLLAEARKEVPPKIQELLLLARVRLPDGSAVDVSRASAELPFQTRYAELRREAWAYVGAVVVLAARARVRGDSVGLVRRVGDGVE